MLRIRIDISPNIYIYIQITNKHMKICSTSLAIKEMPVTATMKYYFTFTSMVLINKTDNI